MAYLFLNIPAYNQNFASEVSGFSFQQVAGVITEFTGFSIAQQPAGPQNARILPPASQLPNARMICPKSPDRFIPHW